MRAPVRALLTLAALAGAGPAAGQERAPQADRGPAWLGIGYEVRWLQRDDRCEPRVIVETVVHGSPAERAGLRPGDAIVAVDGQPAPVSRLRALSARLSTGDSVRLRFERGGAVRAVTAVADRRPSRPATASMGGSMEWLSRTTAPVVRIRGDTLEAWNVEPASPYEAGPRGYWIAASDGRTEFRRLDDWGRDGLDRRVAELLVCAESLNRDEAPVHAAGVSPHRIRERADSLRIVIARRALEAAGDRERVVLRVAPDPEPQVEAVQLAGPEVLFRRLEEHAVLGSRAVAGAEMIPLERELAEYFRGAERGLLVLRVESGSPAARSGLRPGDVVTRGGGRAVDSVDDLRRALSGADGAPVELRLVRHGRVRTVTLRD